MGAGVGAPLGADEGMMVGFGEGAADGNEVGAGVGPTEGDGVGALVGVAVGLQAPTLHVLSQLPACAHVLQYTVSQATESKAT